MSLIVTPWDDYDLATWTIDSREDGALLSTWTTTRSTPGVAPRLGIRALNALAVSSSVSAAALGAVPTPGAASPDSAAARLVAAAQGKDSIIVFDTCSLVDFFDRRPADALDALDAVATMHLVVVPWIVIVELDKMKVPLDNTRSAALAYKSRTISKWILQKRDDIFFQARSDRCDDSFELTTQNSDDRVVGCAKWVQQIAGPSLASRVNLCTEDCNMKIKCASERIPTVSTNDLFVAVTAK